jgi:hypothetical protein
MKEAKLQDRQTEGIYKHVYRQCELVTCLSDYRQGFGLVDEFIEYLQIVTTSIYSAIVNSHTRLV